MTDTHLWIAVIEQAISDATSKGSGSGNDASATWREKKDAINWIKEGGEAMRFVCHMAGVPVSWVKKAYIERLIKSYGEEKGGGRQ